MLDRTARLLTCCLLAAAVLTGCGTGEGGGEDGSADRPRPTPTRSLEPPTPTRTATDDSAPTRPERTEDTAEPTPDEPTRDEPTRDELTPDEPTPDEPTRRPAKTQAPQPSEESAPTPSATADASTTSATTDDESSGTPAWVWWLVAALVLTALVGAIVAWLHSRRRHRWLADLQVAEDEVRWFAHELIPELRGSTSLDQVVGGWNIASTRVGAAEDRLTVLESTAPGDADGSRARTLRDAVRLATQRLDALTVVAPHDTWSLDLDEVAADLEVALGPAPPQVI